MDGGREGWRQSHVSSEFARPDTCNNPRKTVSVILESLFCHSLCEHETIQIDNVWLEHQYDINMGGKH